MFSLAWSPAGDRIALDNGLEGHVAIYTFAPDGSDFTEVITGGSGAHWSPDGSQIAYGAMPGTPGLSIADADGSNVRTFDFGAAGPWHPGTPSPSVESTPPPSPSLEPAKTSTVEPTEAPPSEAEVHRAPERLPRVPKSPVRGHSST